MKIVGVCASIAFGSAVALSQAAAAQTTLSFYIGMSFTRSSDLRVVMPHSGNHLTFRNVAWESRPFRFSPYYGIRLTHYSSASPQVSLSLDFTHNKLFDVGDRIVRAQGVWHGGPVDEIARMDQRVQAFEITHGLNMLSLNVLYYPTRAAPMSVSPGMLDPYIGAGIVFYVMHAENTIDNKPWADGYRSSGLGYQVLAGVQCRRAPRCVFLEAKYSSGEARVGTAEEGHAQTHIRTLHTIGGYTF